MRVSRSLYVHSTMLASCALRADELKKKRGGLLHGMDIHCLLAHDGRITYYRVVRFTHKFFANRPTSSRLSSPPPRFLRSSPSGPLSSPRPSRARTSRTSSLTSALVVPPPPLLVVLPLAVPLPPLTPPLRRRPRRVSRIAMKKRRIRERDR